MSEDLQTRFKLTYYRSRDAGRIAVMTMDNGHDHRKPNVFGAGALASLEVALEQLESESDVKGLMLTGKPFIFAVGADTSEFRDIDPDRVRQGITAGHSLFSRVMALPYPTLAAINGACMGGGLEIALHCDYRTISTGAAAIAFPEVFLSILPGWGGTQLTPRLIGGPKALELIVQNALDNNRTLKPQQAFELGLGDRLIDSASFLDDSRELLEQLMTGEVTIERGLDPAEGLDEALADTRAFVDNKVHGATQAPYRAIECIEFAARGGDLEEGRQREIDAMVELLPADQAQAAIYAFGLTQRRIKKQPWKPDVPGRRIRKIAVVGSGLMGAQMGALFLQRYEVPLVMKDIAEEVLDDAREHIEGELYKLVQKGRLEPGRAEFLKGLVTYTTDDAPIAGADFVIEAVLEKMGLKQSIFADIEQVVDEGAVLATNTSSLSVEEMASGLEHPERLVGFHFFNPISVMPFLEIVRPDGASDEAVATAFDVAKKIKKSAVQCADTPAFIVNRLLTRFNGAGIEALRHGNDFRSIDEAYKQLGLPMGPFELFGFVGIKVAYHTAETLHEAFPDRFELDENFARIAELDVHGIYDWGAGGEPHQEVLDLVEVDPSASELSAQEIQQAALEAAAEEARIMVDEGAVADARDIDTGMLLGAGFPFFLGGICKHLDQTGVSQKVSGRPLIEDRDAAFSS